MKLKYLTILLAGLGFASQAVAITPFVVKDIRVEGLQRTEPETVFAYLPIKVGESLDDQKSEEIIRDLYSTGFFDDVRVEVLNQQLLLSVTERPVIERLRVEGGTSIRNDAIEKNFAAIGLTGARLFDRTLLNQAIDSLLQEYRNRGKNSATVTPEITQLDRNRVDVVLKIDEGITTVIRSIEFRGNQHVAGSALRHIMSLSTGGLFSRFTRSNRFSEDKFRDDLQAIENYYQDRGYFDFHFTHVDVRISDDKKNQDIVLDVHEGERYHFGKVSVEGDTKEVPLATLNALIKMKEGDWYNRSELARTVDAIQAQMGKAGYAFSQVDVVPSPNETTHTVDFTLNVNPARKIYVNQINIEGNNKTQDEVVRRELRQMEKAPYDLSKVQRSKVRIDQLGYFDDAVINATPVPSSPDEVNLDVVLKERSTGSLNIAAGWAQGDGLVLSGSVAQDNLFGTGKSVSARVSNARVSRVAALSFTDPYFTPDGISLGYDAYYRGYNPSRSDNNRSGYRTTTTGGGLRLGVPVTEFDRVNFGLGLEQLKVDLFPRAPHRYVEFVGKQPPSSRKDRIVKGTIGWGRNKTDSALWPTRGYIISANIDAGLPGGTLQYYIANHDQRWFFPLSPSFTLMLAGEFGVAQSYGRTKELPFFYNFYGGGLGSVRGYETGTLGPKFKGSADSTASSYGGTRKAYVSSELLFPLPGVKDSRSVRLSLFADAGSVWDNKKYPYMVTREGQTFETDTGRVYGADYHSTFSSELRYSAGAALTWLSPLGPMKFSYAYPLNRKKEDQVQRFQFQLGTTF